MSGGGAKSVIYLGLLKLLKERNIEIEVLGGLSGGALISGLIASGKEVDDILEIIDHVHFRRLIDINPFDGIELLDQKKVLNLLRSFGGDTQIEDLPKKILIFATTISVTF